MLISGEFRTCEQCRQPLAEQYPEGTNFTTDTDWWGYYVTAHTVDCPARFPEVEIPDPESIEP